MSPRLALSLLLVSVTLPLGAVPATRDYAYQAPLEEADQPLQRVELPLEILLALTRPDLGDLAVFDAQGKPLPHSVAQARPSVAHRTRNLPFHEFSRFLDRHSRTVTTREQNREPGTITELETTETRAIRTERSDYLIELSPGDETPEFERLELEWRHQPAGQLLELKVEAGNELDRLRVIQQRKHLTNRQSEDESWRSIDKLPRNTKYLRLTPHSEVTSFELLKVTGHYRETSPAPQLSHALEVTVFEDESGSYYHFTQPSAVPAAALRIVPADNHGIVAGDLYALWNGIKRKRRIHSGFRQHNIAGDGVKPSQPLDLPRRSLTEIWFTSKTDLAVPPRVELLYPRYEVVFLGDGNGPYTLAWGNHETEVRAADLSGLLDGNLQDAQRRATAVGMGTPREAGGPARLAAQPALPWKKWLLWALLIVAALITGRMALRLYREMNSADPA